MLSRETLYAILAKRVTIVVAQKVNGGLCMGLFDIFRKGKTPRIPTERTKNQYNITPKISESVSNFTSSAPLKTEIDSEVIPVEKRVKTAIASKHGLYPHEILVLDYAPSFYTSSNRFQGFWWYKYGVRDIQAILQSLVKRGFLEIGDIRGALEKQTAASIKYVLKDYNVKTTGKKADLVQRALDKITENELNQHFPRRPFKLTTLGQQELKVESYVPYVHKHRVEDLDIWSLNRIVHTEPYLPFRDKIWGYLNQRCMKHFSERNFGLYRNCRLNMSQFLKEENKIKDSLAMLAEVVFFDLSGATNNFHPQFLDIYAKSFFPYKNSLATTAPGIISEISQCQEELGYTDEELKLFLAERMSILSVPLQLFTVDECVTIVLYERDGNKEALKMLYENARKTFKQKYPQIKI